MRTVILNKVTGQQLYLYDGYLVVPDTVIIDGIEYCVVEYLLDIIKCQQITHIYYVVKI